MKNLSSIPHLPLYEAFTILITLAVCLAAFTEAEIHSNLRKHSDKTYKVKEASLRENAPQYSYKTPKLRGGELQQPNVEKLNNFPGGSLDKLTKRQSDDFGESADSESEKENDGYGYDDDEYYHLNYKRNNDAIGSLESSKMSKNGIGESNKKEGISSPFGQKFAGAKAQKDSNEKETQTIEMLNFKEFHPNLGTSNENQNQNNPAQNTKPLVFDSAHKKLPASSLDSLNMRDLKENSAIDEKLKKEEGAGVLAAGSSDSKAAEGKKNIKAEDKEKLKDAKIAEESEKKDKEASLKDVKDNVANKNLKESEKSSEVKEKNLKLSDNAKLEDNLEKLNAKNKDGETAKIAKEDKDNSKLVEKEEVALINAGEISPISSRANFVSNDYKDNMDAIKPSEGLDDEKDSEELSEGEKNVGLTDYGDLRERKEKLRERQLAVQDSPQGSAQESRAESTQNSGKEGEYVSFPVNFEIKDENESDYFKKRASWKDHGKFRFQPEQLPQMQTDQQPTQDQQQQPQMSYERDFKNSYHLKFPPGELENTEYHKNFIKSLKRYKNLNENLKVLNPEAPSSSGNVEKPTAFQENPESRKKKRSKPMKRRSMISTDEEIPESAHSKLRRNAYRAEKRWYPTQRQDVLTKPDKDDSTLFENKQYDGQQEVSRQRRKSPAKLEYEIKIINQNQQDSRNAPLSSLRMKKNAKAKLSSDDKYLKKYPYSQVKRDDLLGFGSEKKYKRKAPVWMKKDQSKESVIQTRSLPSGYYGNRVKFGQKSFARTEDKSSPDQSATDMNKITYAPNSVDKANGFQRAWEFKPQDYKHDPMKRYDASNSLLLIKKDQNGERITKAFEETTQKDQDDRVGSSDQLAKLLSKDNDYLILKKTETNQFQKVSEPDDGTAKQEETGPSFQLKKDDLESEPQDKLSAKNKGVYIRSSHKDDKKYSSNLRTPSTKSNLKKTFEKFRDLADFFKDNEPEAADNQYQTQEAKEGRDIVFSEDKLPDPIVINNDPSKADNINQKPTNSIYSISNNFKHLDQQDRKDDERKEGELNKNMLTAEVKADGQEFSWEPALKNAFPEAKSINSMSKNGNEIIVLDFNRNQLKNEHGYLPVGKSSPKPQPASGSIAYPNSRLLNSMGQRQVEVVLPSKLAMFDKKDEERAMPSGSSNGPFAVFKGSDGETQVSIPLNQLNQLGQIPGLFKAFPTKKQSSFEVKSVMKKNAKAMQETSGSENYNQFLRDLRELTEINKKGKFASKRDSKEILLPASSFPELTGYTDVNMRKLGSLLASILTNQNVEENVGENMKPTYSKSDQWYPAAYDVRRQNQWSSEAKNNEHSVINTKEDDPLTTGIDKESIDSVVQNDEVNKKYQEEIREDMAGSSGRIQRLRREGKRKLRKAVEDAMSLAEQSQTEMDKCPVQGENKCMIKMASDSSGSKDTTDSKLREEEESKDSTEHNKALKSDYEDHLSELFENLSLNKNQKDQLIIPNESTPIRGKRKDYVRRKRSSRRDVKNNVSTTEVQNRILKNLPEDNYSSVYSPGIKRKLLSTENDAEDADGYYGADEHDRSEMAERDRANCANNAGNKCVDPMILELFGAEEAAGEKNRDRRSLTAGFHSNFKREIDLDESMPNDFQNFLVTSLGGFGSQKREVVKKDEALWEGKESSQENFNQIVDSSPGGKDASEDSALEKREVSPVDSRKAQKYKANYFGPRVDSDKKTVSRSEKITRSEDKSIGSKVPEYEDKVPTRIRIQITNASGKEKKSSKPIMDESETTSTEMENLPKEKEFFDKNKVNQLGVNNLPKLHQFSKPKFSLLDYDDVGAGDDKQKTYAPRPYRRRRRKKKKYVTENPMKPIKDFIAFDQKAMEILLRKYMADQNLGNDQHATTQKVPMSNHLPQVETVYNPTQGTNKAQLDSSRITKMNSISNKNSDNAKNSLQANEASAYDEGILRSYLKDKASKAKPEKTYGKEFEDAAEWKSYSGKARLRTDNLRDSPNDLSFQNFKNFAGDAVSFSTNPSQNTPESHFFQSQYNQKWPQNPYNNYLYQPPNTNIMNSNSFYDALKLKQELKNFGLPKGFMMKDHSSQKPLQKPYFFSDGNLYNKPEDKERNFNFASTTEPSWNTFDYSYNKKPFNQKLKSDFFNPALKNQIDARSKSAYPIVRNKFSKTAEGDKMFEAPQSHGMETSKDLDYIDPLEDEYSSDDDAGKDLQFDEPVIADSFKKQSKIYDPNTFHHMYSYKNADLEDNMSDTDEEFEDEYDETTDEDDLDDYSLLANMREPDQEIPKNSHLIANLQGTYRSGDSPSHLSTFFPKSNQFELKGNSFEQMEFNNPKTDDKFESGRQTMPLVDLKNNIDPLSSSTDLLKKANENSNIFGKNLMKNLNKYSYDESWRNPEKLQDDQPSIDLYPKYGRKIRKTKYDWRKLKRNHSPGPQIGNRIFYVAKSQMPDNPNESSMTQTADRRQDQRERIALMAQFTAADNNDFEYEFENKGKQINGMNNREGVKDVQENLEDNGETISEDNVLENIIGKYIMRKRVQSSPTEIFEGEKKIQKRSTHLGKPRKLVRKRLSSGHLTENNFKKFHKKNFLAKRHTDKGDMIARHILRREQNLQCPAREHLGDRGEEKRSALDIFKRITNKDKENKKADTSESHGAGFEPLLNLSDKKTSTPSRAAEETPSAQTKKLAVQEKSNPKLHSNYEPMDKGSKESVSERKKEKAKMSPKAADGPWKLDLNDKWNLAEWDSGAAESNHKGNNDPRAYFVVGKNMKRAKRKFQGAFSTAGSSQTEVGTSHRPRFEEGKAHVRKRSLDPSMVQEKGAHEDAAQASPKEPITENFLAIQQHNRALHDTQSLSEGDSDPQAPHVLQSNSNINASFVTADDQNPRFLSKGKLTNLKSVFPTLTDANIIRDSRDINEGTSEYIGQRIVEAILSQASANAKFKDLIAPGLSKRTTVLNEGAEEKRRALHQLDFDEQLQSFLNKFMFDLQKLAEQHVRKRMCNEIDKHTKQFLQSLLHVPARKSNKRFDNDTPCQNSYPSADVSATDTPIADELFATEPPFSTQDQDSTQTGSFTSLKRKRNLLIKLIGEYQNLPKIDQESLKMNYRYLVQELDNVNRELALPQSFINPTAALDFNEALRSWKVKHKKKKNKGLEEENYNICSCKALASNNGTTKCQSSKNRDDKAIVNCPVSPFLPSFIFSPVQSQPLEDYKPLKPNVTQNFEVVTPTNLTESNTVSSPTNAPYPLLFFDPIEGKKEPPSAGPSEKVHNSSPAGLDQQKNTSALLKGDSPANIDFPSLSTASPQIFDLYPVTNSVTLATDHSLESGSFRIKQSAPTDDSVKGKDASEPQDTETLKYDNLTNQSALHTLSTGDAAGLQLSLKSRDPWVSTLDFAKNFRSLPNSLLQEKIVETPETNPTTKFKYTRSLIVPGNDNSQLQDTYYNRPVFPYSIDKKFYTRKTRPFLSAAETREKTKQENFQVLPFQYFLRKYRLEMKQQPRTHGLDSNNRRKKKKRVAKVHRKRFGKSEGGIDGRNAELQGYRYRSSMPVAVGRQRRTSLVEEV